MNPGAVTEMLAPLRTPEAVSWWPLAPGWWLVIALVLLGLTFAAYQGWRYYQRGAVLRDAKALLHRLEEQLDDPRQCLAQTNALHRRVGLALGERRDCAGLTGREWVDFLNGLSRDDTASLDPDLLALAYAREVSRADAQRLLEQTAHWLQRLERPA